MSQEFQAKLERLVRAEKLDDFPRLLAPREHDEVPLVSRYRHIEFMAHLPALEQTKVLVLFAAQYLSKVVEQVAPERRLDTVVMVSITEWEDLEAADGGPALPNFWISSDKKRDLSDFRMRLGVSERARLVAQWLRGARVDEEFLVLEPAVPSPGVGRVYVARRDDPTVADLIVR